MAASVMAASTKVVLCQACGEEASALDRRSVSGGGGAQNVLAVWTELFSVEIIMPHNYRCYYSHLLRLELRVPLKACSSRSSLTYLSVGHFPLCIRTPLYMRLFYALLTYIPMRVNLNSEI